MPYSIGVEHGLLEKRPAIVAEFSVMSLLSPVIISTLLVFTSTVMVAFGLHGAFEGKNVYVVVAMVFTAGNQVPLMPLVDVVGNTKVSPTQIGAT